MPATAINVFAVGLKGTVTAQTARMNLAGIAQVHARTRTRTRVRTHTPTQHVVAARPSAAARLRAAAILPNRYGLKHPTRPPQ